jgi:hypothetical protein
VRAEIGGAAGSPRRELQHGRTVAGALGVVGQPGVVLAATGT